MRFRRRIRIATVIGGALVLAPGTFAASWPDWAERAGNLGPPFETKAAAVDLFRETVIRFDGSERVTLVERRVTRIRTHEGRSVAVAVAAYPTDGGHVRELRAWLKHPSGKIAEVDTRGVVDAAEGTGDVYNEMRVRGLDASADADTGSIFAWESIVDQRTPVAQFTGFLQDDRPALRSRFRVEAPGNWTPHAAILNHAPVEPVRDGTGWAWEITGLGDLEDEPWGIPASARAPRFGVTLVPKDSDSESAVPPLLRWEDVSGWVAKFSDPQAIVTPALEAKAQALTSGRATLDGKIRAIAGYVQRVNYISIQMSLGRGGGYRPHAATDVLAKNYGDCKDKANLMRALLRAVGIDAYLVVISAVDPEFVKDEWPSPGQFNHCIIAVRADAGAASQVEIPGIGALTLFDPTSVSTPWGLLPAAEQDAPALLISEQRGRLFRTPPDIPNQNRVERVIEAELKADGSLSGIVRESSSGEPGSIERNASQSLPRAEYAKRIEERIGGDASGVSVGSVKAGDDSTSGFGFEAAFRAARYARPVAGFLSFCPVVAEPIRIGATWPEKRSGPLRFGFYTLEERGTLRLPTGYTLEELPAPVKLETPFAEYRYQCRLTQGALTFERSLRILAKRLSVEDYGAARRFFGQVRAAEATQTLLTRG